MINKEQLKFKINRWVGQYLPEYAAAKEMSSYLRNEVPPFMKQRLVDNPPDKRLLIASMGWYDAKTEAIYAKALEALGYEPYILTNYDPLVADIFKIFGIRNVRYYENIFKKFSPGRLKMEAGRYLETADGKDILKIYRNDIGAGKFALSSFMRKTRSSNYDMGNDEMRALLSEDLTYSLRAVDAAEYILKEIEPDLVFVIDRGYTPVGQLFDACLKRGIPVVTRNSSHKSGWEIIKRYTTKDMSIIHPHSLSSESWEYIKKISWSDDRWQELYNDLAKTYGSGDWFSEVGTQFSKRIYTKEGLISMLRLDPSKKTAIVFPHMFWDATFFYGEDLFADYYDWFINVLKVAARNTNLNWIIKVHPANVVKAKRDNYKGEHKELAAIYETLGEIPGHIKIIQPESDINTFGLFAIMDYCLTVRGTIGIEASAMGINTLTAGTGRYERLGFTHDFDSRKDYLDCIGSLEDMPSMGEDAKEMARRFAYGIFIMRPICLDLLEHGYNADEKASMRFCPLFKNREEFEESSFVEGFRKFVTSQKEDYLNS